MLDTKHLSCRFCDAFLTLNFEIDFTIHYILIDGYDICRFGMIHDGHGNDCSDDPSDGKIMASMVQSNYHTYYWTPCNKVAMEKYLV